VLHCPEDADDPEGGPGSRKRAKEVQDVDWRPAGIYATGEDIDATGEDEPARGGVPPARRAI
jgi:hypothetical protein